MKKIFLIIALTLVSCSSDQDKQGASSDDDALSQSFSIKSDVQIRSFRKIYHFFVQITQIDPDYAMFNSGPSIKSQYENVYRDILPAGGEPSQYTSNAYTTLIKFSGFVCDAAYLQKTSFYDFDYDSSVLSLKSEKALKKIAESMSKKIFGYDRELMRIETEETLVETMTLTLDELSGNNLSGNEVKRATLVSACTLLLSSPAAVLH